MPIMQSVLGTSAVMYYSHAMTTIKRSVVPPLYPSSMGKGIFFGLLLASFGSLQAFAADSAEQGVKSTRSLSMDQSTEVTITKFRAALEQPVKRVNFNQEVASQDARQVADWVVDSGDNRGIPFMIVDKKEAKVFVFHADGLLRGAAPALLGLALGDDSVPGIGNRKLSTILPDERTTPAGRFVAALDRNLHGGEILWVDYDAAISLHPVITTNPKEQRAQRLASPSVLDNRISYGCINVPAEFFKNVVSAAFKGTNGIVYVLPETRSSRQVFASYDVDERERSMAAGQRLPAQVASQVAPSLTGR